ncbi:acyl-CoA N-acyltransferase [Lentinula raphanica]|nr:acyl-CoA N-acyltransferase [Lentinula raphanica]
MCPSSRYNGANGVIVRVCPPSLYRSIVPQLAVLLKSCIDSNITMNFLQPFSLEDASEFWLAAEESVIQGKELVMIAQEDTKEPVTEIIEGSGEPSNDMTHDPSTQPPVVLGCVILYLAQTPNAKHRGEVGKLIVHQEHRKRKIGKMLLDCLEDEARKDGRTIIILDTQTGSGAEKFYEHIGYCKVGVGVIPDASLAPDGKRYTSCTFFYKKL